MSAMDVLLVTCNRNRVSQVDENSFTYIVDIDDIVNYLKKREREREN